jgi:nucleoid DNA-binding protein
MRKSKPSHRLYSVKEQSFVENGCKVKKFYAMPNEPQTLSFDQLLDKMELSPLRRADIEYGWNRVIAAAQEAIERGQSVQLKGFGRLSVSCSSTPVDNPRKVTPSTVTAKRLVFIPDRRLRATALNVKYSKME